MLIFSVMLSAPTQATPFAYATLCSLHIPIRLYKLLFINLLFILSYFYVSYCFFFSFSLFAFVFFIFVWARRVQRAMHKRSRRRNKNGDSTAQTNRFDSFRFQFGWIFLSTLLLLFLQREQLVYVTHSLHVV